ncbi:MarR family winged helix-turn-helix transcriptional regulator [Acidovorax sp. SRB_24]|uniref:MarR family winged helix-turn-helix transcriptional regulator n=1 Tax=Acidovorax sp. SRB_24 TaxID=1962700 RepID=UPI00197B4254|nr:AsnC family transcriptional regulator [Acidovorax sp. SRB_24]NMM78589.1 hypothetical protein [Acidovorax sp. SRB_24]
MSLHAFDALEFCLSLSHAHARLSLKMDEDLGVFHGLGFGDFVLLHRLGNAPGGRLAMADLAQALGMTLSALTRKLLQFEKIGLAARDACLGGDGHRYALIRPAGRRLMEEAAVTASALCAAAVQRLEPACVSEIQRAMPALCIASQPGDQAARIARTQNPTCQTTPSPPP